MRARSSLWLTGSLLLIVGCSHKLEDPKPTVGALLPNVVCDAQLTTAVAVTGTNLTPVPTKTLAGGEVLADPTVTLSLSTDLSGAPMSSAAVVLNQSTDTSNTHVRWESERQMSFDIWPELMLTDGVYDVAVANPDGKTATLSQSLAVVPPPSVTAVMPTDICDAQQMATITITGQSFLVIGDQTPEVDVFDANGMALFTAMATASNCTPVAAQLGESLQSCTTLTFVVPTDALPAGSYTLKVTNPAPAACASTESIPFVVEPPPVLTDVIPATLCQGGGTLDLKGMNFLPTATASLDDPATMQMVAATSTTVSADGTDAVAKFLAPGGLTLGDTLDVTISNNDGCSSTLAAKVTVTAGPIIFYVDPPYVYGGIITPVTVYTTGGITLLKSVTLTPTGQPGATPIDVTAQSAIDAKHPNHVIINVPASLAAGAYDVTISDQSDCPATYPKAITVVTQTTPIDIAPRYGDAAQSVPVRISAATSFFKGGARAYFAPHGAATPTAVPLASVVFQSATALTAVVPPIAAGTYDVIVVNPDGTIGFLANGYTSVSGKVPSIDSDSPGSIASSCANSGGCNLPLTGENFDATAMVAASCQAGGSGTAQAVATPIVGTPAPTSITLDLTAAAALGIGTVCTFHLTQSVGGVTVAVDGGTLIVRNPSANLSATTAGMPLNTARRGHGLALSGPTASARYLYAVGGDDAAGSFFDTVELASVDPARANMGAWLQLPSAALASATQGRLPSKRTFLGLASVGPFLYAVGGLTGATTATTSVVRAESLDPAESPLVNDADLSLDATAGLAPGLYYYRVAAIMAAGDPLNPSGETLASDEFAINVPSFGSKKIDITIAWSTSAALGTRSVTSWRIYRTSAPNAAPGSEDQFADVPGSAASIVDKGSAIAPPSPSTTTAAYAAGKPMPFGAIGNWTAAAAQLGTARAGAGVTHAVIGGVDYIYAGYGTDGSTFPATYDAFSVTGAAANAPVETAQAGALVTSRGRWQLGAYAVTADVDPNAGGTFIEFGNGNGSVAAGMAVSGFDRCSADATTGALTCSGTGLGSIGPVNANVWGYGAGTIADTLFEFGGDGSGGFTDKIGSAPDTATPSFTANGGGQILSGGAAFPVAFLGTTIGGAYFWLAGGQTATATVTPKTFYVLY